MSDFNTRRRDFLKAAASVGALGAAEMAASAPSPPAVGSLAATDAAGMRVRVLGRTGVEVPIIHLGTSQRLDPKYDKVMHRCFESGVTWFDTALSYGWGASHRAIKNFLIQIGDRDKLWLTSKSGSSGPSGLMRDADEACKELGTDYLNLYLMHGIDDERMLDREYREVGEKLKKAGKIQFFGFSCHDGNVAGLLSKAAKIGGIDAILFRYNFRRYGDRELNLAIDACYKAGVGLLAMKTMGSVPRDLEAVAGFRSENFTLGQAKLKSVWADERVASICSEMDSVQRVRENVEAAKTVRALSAEEAHQLNQLAALTASHACNGCKQHCESATGGRVAIASVLRYLMYYECYGKRERARDLYRAIPRHARSVDGVSLAPACAVCPQGIDIPARLREARRLLG